MKRILLLLPLFILIIITTIAVKSLYINSQKQSLDSRLQAGEEVFLPQFLLPDLYDSTQNISNQNFTGKYSLINFFASWCAVCAEDHQLLMQLSKSKKINIYGVVWQDIEENTKKYLEEKGNPYVKVAVDNKKILSKLLAVDGVPESFLIDEKGRIIYHQKGLINQELLELIK